MPIPTATGRSRSRGQRVEGVKEAAMSQREKQQQDLPAKHQDEIDREAERSREALDSVPEPGTDPLHEGP